MNEDDKMDKHNSRLVVYGDKRVHLDTFTGNRTIQHRTHNGSCGPVGRFGYYELSRTEKFIKWSIATLSWAGLLMIFIGVF